jgi:hypothetical protein
VVRKPFVALLGVAVLLAATAGASKLWLHVAHQRALSAYHRAERSLARLDMQAAFGSVSTTGANCFPTADRRCLVSPNSPAKLVKPLMSILGTAARIEPGTDCTNWDPRPHGDLRAVLTHAPCTVIGEIGGHQAAGILWLHHFPTGTRHAPRGAIRINEGRFVNFYGGTDITIELVRPPSGA